MQILAVVVAAALHLESPDGRCISDQIVQTLRHVAANRLGRTIATQEIDQAVGKILRSELFQNAGIGAGKREIALVRAYLVLVEQSRRADRADLFRIVAIKNGVETRQVVVMVELVDDVGQR